jgi:hypothetical protein
MAAAISFTFDAAAVTVASRQFRRQGDPLTVRGGEIGRVVDHAVERPAIDRGRAQDLERVGARLRFSGGGDRGDPLLTHPDGVAEELVRAPQRVCLLLQCLDEATESAEQLELGLILRLLGLDLLDREALEGNELIDDRLRVQSAGQTAERDSAAEHGVVLVGLSGLPRIGMSVLSRSAGGRPRLGADHELFSDLSSRW